MRAAGHFPSRFREERGIRASRLSDRGNRWPVVGSPGDLAAGRQSAPQRGDIRGCPASVRPAQELEELGNKAPGTPSVACQNRASLHYGNAFSRSGGNVIAKKSLGHFFDATGVTSKFDWVQAPGGCRLGGSKTAEIPCAPHHAHGSRSLEKDDATLRPLPGRICFLCLQTWTVPPGCRRSLPPRDANRPVAGAASRPDGCRVESGWNVWASLPGLPNCSLFGRNAHRMAPDPGGVMGADYESWRGSGQSPLGD